MNNLKSWLQFLRFPNLIIVALTQYLMRFCVLRPLTLEPVFTEVDFFIMVLGTMIVAAGGYLINDVYDYEMDRINKPEKTFVNALISKQNALLLYGLTCILVFAVGGYFYIRTGWQASFMYPIIGISMLWLYSFWLKRTVLLGNITVALFCAFVPFMVYVPQATIAYPEFELIRNFNMSAFDPLRNIFYAYAGFAFLSTLYRELVKDIEDQEGDKAYNGRTLPIVFGEKVAKYTTILVGLAFLYFIGYIMYWEYNFGSTIRLYYASFAVFMPVFYTLCKLILAKAKHEYHHLSQVIKFVMVLGLLYIVVFYLTS